MNNPDKAEKSNSEEKTAERLGWKKTVLKRGCSMIKSLFEMSRNGTSFEELLKWHQNIQNISFPLPKSDGKHCYPPFLTETTRRIIYQVHTETSRYSQQNF